jgi:type IV pilus assembly protein PilB
MAKESDSGDLIPSQEALGLLSKEIAATLLALPLRVEKNALVVALPEGFRPSVVADVSFLVGKKVSPVPLAPALLSELICKYYGAAPQVPGLNAQQCSEEFVSLREIQVSAPDSASDGSAVRLANKLITEAITKKASDIHIEPYEKTLRIRYRLDGVLREMHSPAPSMVRPLVSRLKIMADLDIAEKRRPQDGRIRVKEGGRSIDIRVSTLPTDFGEKIVLRILDKSSLQLDLARLGFEEKDLKTFQRAIRLPFGMILVTGPTGSGKTTTLYAALNYINKPEINITTIEDPIEYNLQGINQTHVRPEIGLDFAGALRSILRQDPNVIMVGEIRDAETAEIAIRAALTGHLVFSTLHTNDAASAVTRLIDMGVEPFLVASSLKMILAQRLLRKLCPHCAIRTELTDEQREELGLKGERGEFRKGSGCPECSNAGYSGRTAVYEILPVRNGLADLIAKGVTASAIRDHAQVEGMTTLRQSALLKAERGETTVEEVIRET